MKTNLDRLKQLARLCDGEDIVEEYSSERTAKSEFNKMFLFKPWELTNFEIARQLRERNPYKVEEYEAKYGQVDDKLVSLFEKLEEYIKTTQSYDLHSDVLSVSNYERGICDEGEVPHYSVFFGNRAKWQTSGKFTIIVQKKTNTKKRQGWIEYQKAVEDFVREVGCLYPPRSNMFTHTELNSTESALRGCSEKIYSLIPNAKAPCSEKQAYWIGKNMGCGTDRASILNKAQASELLDVLFGGSSVVSDEVLAHYRKILEMNESVGHLRSVIREVIDDYMRWKPLKED